MNHYNPNRLSKVRSEAIMRAAEGSPCTLRIASFIPGKKCSGPETTVACHLPVWGKGVSTKVTDMAAAFGCATCHAILDGIDQDARRYLEHHYKNAVLERMLHGLTETHALLIQRGVIIIPDAQLI